MMRHVLIIGAGRIGTSIAKLLLNSGEGEYQITLADHSEDALKGTGVEDSVSLKLIDLDNSKSLEKLLGEHAAVVSACGFDVNPRIAQAAAKVGVSYFDLTEDVATSSLIKEISKTAKLGQLFVPQCGLAPGFIGILGSYMAKQFDSLDTLKLRVGALPEFPTNNLMYNLTWSTLGLINEYCNPCQAIKNGQQIELTPLEGLELFSLDGVNYEAFNTSGGLGTLCDTLDGKVHDLTYKTIRYKGHQYLINFLINDLRLGERRELLMQIFEDSLAVTKQDVVLTIATATGMIDGQFVQKTEYRKVYHGEVGGEHWGAIQITTAAGMCTVLDLFFDDKLLNSGYVSQEQIDFTLFTENRFARCFATKHPQ